jgi:hypothetical protein
MELQVLRDPDGGVLAPGVVLAPGASVDLNLDEVGDIDCADVVVSTASSVTIAPPIFQGSNGARLTLREATGNFITETIFDVFDADGFEALLQPGSYRACAATNTTTSLTLRRADDAVGRDAAAPALASWCRRRATRSPV